MLYNGTENIREVQGQTAESCFFFGGGGKRSHEREDMGHEGTGHGTAASETITALLG